MTLNATIGKDVTRLIHYLNLISELSEQQQPWTSVITYKHRRRKEILAHQPSDNKQIAIIVSVYVIMYVTN